MASGNAGKAITGCSGCLVLLCLIATVATVVLPMATDGRVGADEILPAQIGSGACCCLAALGLIIGVGLMVTGKKGSSEATVEEE